MKKKSHKKFIPAEKTQAQLNKKENQQAQNTPAIPSGRKKTEKQRPGVNKPVPKPWYRKPAAAIVFAFVAVAIIGGIAGYAASNQANKPPQNAQNGTAQPTATTSTPGDARIIISNAEVTDIGATYITVKWETNIACMGEAHAIYTDRELTISSFPSGESTLKHEAEIAGIASSSSYKIEIVCKDSRGNKEVMRLDKVFQTPAIRTAMDLDIGDSAPDFALADTAGKIATLSEYKGKWVVIVFWDLSCKSCKEELPYINSYFNSMSNPNLALLTISYKGQTAMIESYLKSQKLSFPALIDSDGAICNKYTIAAYPTTILVNPEGKISRIKQEAFKTNHEVAAFVQEGMAGK